MNENALTVSDLYGLEEIHYLAALLSILGLTPTLRRGWGGTLILFTESTEHVSICGVPFRAAPPEAVYPPEMLNMLPEGSQHRAADLRQRAEFLADALDLDPNHSGYRQVIRTAGELFPAVQPALRLGAGQERQLSDISAALDALGFEQASAYIRAEVKRFAEQYVDIAKLAMQFRDSAEQEREITPESGTAPESSTAPERSALLDLLKVRSEQPRMNA
ncbi:hypothetical protein Deipr_2320 (plasmid) [Deinococcus proteolyticus MRP]|uniref:Uncharacterized protein n=1 Tax=Deinococcus proteolyticus (strain ATCC 35074 / DSM 20540 / JCM 6276 / NBRC 101906 / NCIMB 13154 / VKM Ac-1939 / CCM 2703 / MRP) TaxID=693977 RepID=F0RQ86_DEIPM|nr:hypothetical protein [Deinococcus proteolyticus]ADY27445.1 hypothetical protein Deipr_2320 [Deinococcus proteolyticus MRP]